MTDIRTLDGRPITPEALAGARGELARLADEWWAWRAAEQPRTDDDIPRIERPAGWAPDWSADAVVRYRADLAAFAARRASLPAIDPATTLAGTPGAEGASAVNANSGARGANGTADASATDAPDSPSATHAAQARAYLVDRALIGSSIARARFELDVLAVWQRDPGFYIDQTIGVVFDLLRPEGPFDTARTEDVAAALERIPALLDQGRTNLVGHAQTEPTRLAAATLASAGGRPGGVGEAVRDAIEATAEELAGDVPETLRERLATAGEEAADALDAYRAWLEHDLDTTPWQPIGREAFVRFLREIALNPADPEELLITGRIELERAEAFSVIESRGHRLDSGRSQPREALPAATASACERQHAQEAAIRDFYERQGLLSQPEELRHYRLLPMPARIEPLQWLGVTDDIPAEHAAERDALSWQPDAAEDAAGRADTDSGLGFFDDAIARDPMTGLIHEGCHSQQIALSAAHPDPIRRHYYDSGANEGIGFYNEEMLARAGLFGGGIDVTPADDDPDSRETVHAFLRLRALRVQIDIELALGRLTIDEATRILAERVPMDEPTARWEAAFFAKTPGQGMTYQVGKTQILGFLAAAVRSGLTLREFHDRLWREGNVPIALQRYELLGDVAQLRGLVL